MAGSNVFGVSKFGEGNGGGSGTFSSRSGRRFSASEFGIRHVSQLAATAPFAARSMCPFTCPNQLQEGREVLQSTYCPLSVPPLFSCKAPLAGRQEMIVGSEDENGCDLELRLGPRRWNEGESVPGAQQNQKPPFLTKLLLGLEAEEESGHRKKKARTDSWGCGIGAWGSSSGQELDLELRLSLYL